MSKTRTIDVVSVGVVPGRPRAGYIVTEQGQQLFDPFGVLTVDGTRTTGAQLFHWLLSLGADRQVTAECHLDPETFGVSTETHFRSGPYTPPPEKPD